MTDVVKAEEHLPAQSGGGVDNILKETSRSNPRLLFKKGKFYIGEDQIPLGREYVAFPLDWARGWVKWEDGRIVDAQHMDVLPTVMCCLNAMSLATMTRVSGPTGKTTRGRHKTSCRWKMPRPASS
jgi:hypothetical protein